MHAIVNGDDLGLTHEANLGIAEAFRLGLIDQSTLVVNSEFSEEGAETARKHGFADKVGLHLNLVECEPLSDAIRALPEFVQEGVLCYTPKFMREGSIAESPLITFAEVEATQEFADLVAAVRDEVLAQIRRFRELGFASKHIDSHLCTHYDLPVWLALRDVLVEGGFRTLRPTHDSFKTNDLYNRMYVDWLEADKARVGIESIDYVSSGPRLHKRRAELEGELGDAGVVEIYVHPYLEDGVLKDNLDERIPLTESTSATDGLEHTNYYELFDLWS